MKAAGALCACLVAALAVGGAPVHAQTADAGFIRAAYFEPRRGLEPFWAPNKSPAPKGQERLPEIDAPHVIAIEVETGRVLGARAADRAIPPASMTKIMTALMVFEALDRGDLRLDQRVEVSMRAARAPGSTLYLTAGDRPTVEELVRGVLTVSGNDAAIALAEAVAGSEAAFALEMTRRAAELGLKSASFKNASGLTADGHEISVEDLARLSRHIFFAHPTRAPYFGERGLGYAGVWQANRNPAVFLDLSDVGAVGDGLKTGYTRAAGYCVAASARVRTEDGEKRIIVVLAGLGSEAARRRETEIMLRWAIDLVR